MKDKPAAKAPRAPGTPLVELGLGLAWLLGAAAMLQVVELLFGRVIMAAAIAGAVIADLAATWAGVRWDEGEKRPWKAAVARLGAGASVAAGVIALMLTVGAALGRLEVSRGAPSIGIFLVVLRCVAIAVRDELVFRGIPLVAAARAGIPGPVARAYAALAGAAAMALLPGASPASIALTAASGWLFATLWQRDRGAWGAVGAHAAWALLTSGVLRGGLLDISVRDGNFGLGPRAAGAPAWIAAVIALVAAALLPKLPGFRAPRG
jgi:membrane protease YdiL (CAAX protease family)